MSEVVKEEIKKTFLEDRKVELVPVPRNNWLGQGHDGSFMYTGCFQSFVLPYDIKQGRLCKILTEDEQTYFENKLYLKPGDLSIYKKADNFWHTFRVKVDKEGLKLDLNDPIDVLRYKVLLIQPCVADSWANRHKSGEYKFALVDENVQIVERNKVSDKKKTAYKFLGQVENSWQKMYDFLRVFGRKPAKNSTREWLVSEIDKIIENSKTLDEAIDIISDPYYEMKLFIEDALENGLIRKPGKAKFAIVGIDEEFTQSDLIKFLNPEGKNQDIYIKIKTQLEDKTK